MRVRSSSIQYRYVKMDGLGPQFQLKEVIVDILRRVPRDGDATLSSLARLRTKDLDQDGSFVLLNKLSSEESWAGPVFSGQLIHVKNGTELPGITGTLDDDLREFELQNLEFEQLTQLVEGVLYFAVVGNHVGMIEGQRTRGRTLERYLTRLLQDAGEFEPGQTITLNTRLQGQMAEINEITVTPKRNTGGEVVETAKDAAEEEGIGKTVIDVLRLFGWGEEQLASLEENIPPDGWLEGKFSAKLRRRKGSASIERGVLEEALRNLDPKAIGLLGEGGKEKGGLIKLSERAIVERKGDLLDPADAMEKIVEAMKKWARSGKIDCAF